ncbi:glycosyltransferase family 2 protein [Streptomyces tsukubensis]|uniref:Glycosyl transferase family 2 n=1 Tax=Streptomyces tsukubensis TaxID=83656 RepID=A0A1V4A2J8_9ACTN|nr:glycosyltransferase family 2 protein [Streptomyces tsukubensis]OON74208.1 glycosyl transferase family 2 [Streptomyces tsukubensis]QFR95269.1 glycosyltransferase [Streptomyces tsukubensis]
MSAVESARVRGVEGQTSGGPAPHRRRAARSGAGWRREVSRSHGLLPRPPDDREKYSYAHRHMWVLTLGSLASFLCLAASQILFTASSPWFWLLLPMLAFVVADYVLSVYLDGFSKDFDLKRHKRLVRKWQPASYPTVDVFLPVCGEPIDVLHNTWTHVRRLASTYQGVVETYVLDDAADADVEAMARDFGFRYVVRENRGWYKKAGNLRNAFGLSDGEHILILDADFAPRADLLDELLPHMDDESIGIVQSPQFFRIIDRQNWIERGAGAVQEQFYRSVQTSREDKDGSICVGSCAVYRRTALDQIGGISLIEHSEDMYTGFDLRALGWKLRYIPVALSAGVCPDTAGAFHNQQYRWCMGSLSLLTSKSFWEMPLRLTTRLCYVSGFLYYLQTALITFLMPLIPLALLVLRPDLLRAEAGLLVLPSLAYVTLVLPLWHRAPYRLEAWAVRMMYGWSHVFAVWDVLRGREMGWKPTGSDGAKKNGMRRYWIGMIGWTGGTAVAWVGVAAWRTLTQYPPDFALMLSAGLFYALVVARVLVQPRTPRTQEVTG